ncbi:transcriptional regulator [Actinomadura sp. WMMA1423]|uniref:transcriptional regulator n=1 Tax=Actinomadura sp. WMMA1423 TaxID=2591108 RepID=UPI00143DE73E|nr:transcriptional regulator [Actinomadura sp. WMMA1423]
MSRALGYAREADLARALDLPQSTVSRWRKGSRPSVEHLVRVSQLLKTQLEPLLVLAGHVDPAVGANIRSTPPEPPEHRTETVRRIEEADLSEDMKETLRRYWDRRLIEERARVYRFIDQFSDAIEPSMEEMKSWLARAYETDLPAHVTSTFLDLLSMHVDHLNAQAAKDEDYATLQQTARRDWYRQVQMVGELYERSMTPDEIGDLIGETSEAVVEMIHEAQARRP